MGKVPDEGVVAHAAAEDTGAGVEDSFWGGVGGRGEAGVFFVVADVVDVFGVALGAGEVAVVVDVDLECVG